MFLRKKVIYDVCFENTYANQRDLVPVESIINPAAITFADAPLAQKPRIQSIPTAQFVKQVAQRRKIPHFTWSEMSYVEVGVKINYDVALKNKEDPSLFSSNMIQDFLNKKSPELVICDMQQYGYGVFANERILKSTIVAIYTGRLLPMHAYQYGTENHYMVQCETRSILFSEFEHLSAEEIKINFDKPSHCIIDSISIGNYSSFFQHLPYDKDLPAQPNFNSIATANLFTHGITYKGYPCYFFTALRDIEKYEQVGFSYGYDYWLLKQQKPVLFTKDGKPSHLQMKLAPSVYEIDNSEEKARADYAERQVAPVLKVNKQYKTTSYGYLNPSELQLFSLINKNTRKAVLELINSLPKSAQATTKRK